MPPDSPPLPSQIYMLLILVSSLAAFVHYLFISKTPKRIGPTGKVSPWHLSPPDFFAGLFAGILVLIALQILLAKLIGLDPNEEPSGKLIFLGAMTHLGALGVLFVFYRTNPEKFHIHRESSDAVRPNPLSWKRTFLIGLYSFLVILPIIYGAAYGWQTLLEMFGHQVEEQDVVKMFSKIDSLSTALLMILLTVLIAPISEEIIFRGCIYRFLKAKIGIPGALALSGILFAMLHQSVSKLIPLFLLGIALAYSYEKSGNLRVPIFFHAIFNANTVVLLLLTEFL